MENWFADYEFDIDVNDVYRVMGYPDASRVSARAKDLIAHQMSRASEYLEPWGSARTIAIERVATEHVHLAGDVVLTSERVARILHCADSLAVGLVTAGDSVRTETRRLMSIDHQADALAVDSIGSVVTERLMNRLDAIVSERARSTQHGTTIYYGPGYTGWKLTDQERLFSFFADENVPVRLNESMMMEPVKSLMGIVGLTPGGKHAPEIVPCQLCDLKNCSMRRVPYLGKTQ